MRERLAVDAPRMTLLVLVLFLRRNGAVYPHSAVSDHIYEATGKDPSMDAMRIAVRRARAVIARAGWPVMIRTAYGIGYSVTWPQGWTMPQAGGNAMPCAEDTSPTSHAPAGDTRS